MLQAYSLTLALCLSSVLSHISFDPPSLPPLWWYPVPPPETTPAPVCNRSSITDFYMMAGTYGRTNNILLEEVIMTEYGEYRWPSTVDEFSGFIGASKPFDHHQHRRRAPPPPTAAAAASTPTHLPTTIVDAAPVVLSIQS